MIAASQHVAQIDIRKMAGKDISLDKFTGVTAKDWIEWLEDYVCYAEGRKWNREKQASNLRFFCDRRRTGLRKRHWSHRP